MKINFLQHLKGISANTLSAYPEMHIFLQYHTKEIRKETLTLVHSTEKNTAF